MIYPWSSGFSTVECSSHPWRPVLEFLPLWFLMQLFDLIICPSRLSSPRRSSSLHLSLPVFLYTVWCVASQICLLVAPCVMDVFSGEVVRQSWSIRSSHCCVIITTALCCGWKRSCWENMRTAASWTTDFVGLVIAEIYSEEEKKVSLGFREVVHNAHECFLEAQGGPGRPREPLGGPGRPRAGFRLAGFDRVPVLGITN